MRPESSPPLLWRMLAKGAGLVGVAAGAAALSGWLLDSEVLKSLLPGQEAMKANTAAGFCLSGWVLYLKTRAPALSSSLSRRMGTAGAIAVALLGLFTVLEYASGADFGIDQWLIHEAPGAGGASALLPAGRMAPSTALCFLFLGLALLVNQATHQGARLAFACAGSVFFLALTAALNVLYAVPYRSGLGHLTWMAASTALVFLVLAAGLICLTPERGVIALLRRPGAAGTVARLLLPAVFILQIGLEWLVQAGERAAIIEAQFGTVLLDVTNILALIALIVWVAVSIARAENEGRRLQETLRKSEELYRSLFENMVEGILVTDVHGNIFAVNPSFEAITGYSQDEVLGRNPRLLQSGRQDRAFYRELWTGLLATGHWRGELWNRRKNGEIHPVWLTLSAVKDALGCTVNYVGVFIDVSSSKEAQQQIDFLTHHDALTRLPNRILLRDRLNLGMQRAQREGHRLALLRLGLDRFKYVNETLGHTVGDGVLTEVARRLAGAIRAGDTLARLDSDEFVLLLDNNAANQEAALARKLLELFAVPLPIAGHEVVVTASIGISLYPDDGTDADTLLKHADLAMRKAKEAGRSTYRFFDPVLSAGLLERLHLEKDLRGALERNQLLLHYQPQVDLYSGEITGVEALLRWRHPDKGLLAAGEFISVAEETGLIVPIGAWVLQSACSQLQAWHGAGYTGVRMSINISAQQFTHGALAESVAQALRDNGLDGRYLELELNESLIQSDTDRAKVMFSQLKALGVGLVLDNFGLGHSIKRLSIDKLKISKSFIDRIVTDPENASIVQAIIAMGHGLHLKVVAEGVETEAQESYLRSLHCDGMQGFQFSQVLPAEEIPALLAAHRGRVSATSPAGGGGRVLLLVDDEANVLSALKRLLRHDGYRILTAASAEEGLQLLAQHRVGVLLSDQRMPGMNGTEFLSRARMMHPQTIRMILSGYTDVNSITESINRGEVYKFLTKPWEDASLRDAIKEAFMRYETSLDGQAEPAPETESAIGVRLGSQ